MRHRIWKWILLALLGTSSLAGAANWPLHVIDASLNGADGVICATEPEGLTCTAAWEGSGGHARRYRPSADPTLPWQVVGAVPNVNGAEGAVSGDFDRDGFPDIAIAREGGHQVNIAWGPDFTRVDVFPVTLGDIWKFCIGADVTQDGRLDLVCGGQGVDVLLFVAPETDPRTLTNWQPVTVIPSAGWVMEITVVDMDGDLDPDIVVSVKSQGVMLATNLGGGVTWSAQRIDQTSGLQMFHAPQVTPLEVHGVKREYKIVRTWRPAIGEPWRDDVLLVDNVYFGTPKAICVGDVDGNGLPDRIVTSEHSGTKISVYAILDSGAVEVINAFNGTKFDRCELVDVNGDGWLDVVTTEEAANLGVIWFENPR